MSAFIVSDKHINTLIHAGLTTYPAMHGPITWPIPTTNPHRYNTLTRETAHQTAEMLQDANTESVNTLYNEAIPPAGILYRQPTEEWSSVDILKLIQSYEYQSCETETWPHSEAAAFCRALQKRIIYTMPGYDDAPWTI